ncbi:hypothetical protein K9N08_00950 [Candidatus Gracilibacteria bacterium]|nr:hypothetical protein [Candidatus Gracilibacteria bacterium]MCF7856111.1 hypothetical protein [Candidatus Gracilibacteria bacterium]MCF7896530.1 hypothetical protein [Candidatus Gracilibacteria bacterium]
MAEIKNKIHRFFEKNIHHIQETLFAATLVFVLGGFFLQNIGTGGDYLKALLLADAAQPQAELLTASSLSLPKETPDGVVKFNPEDIAKWESNDALIKNIFEETLIHKIINVLRYVLGGLFMLFLGLYVLNFLTTGNKEEASKKFNDQLLWAFVGFVVLALAKPFSEAFMLLRDGKADLLTNPDSVLASAQIVGFTYRSAAHLIQYILGGIALITMGVSAFRMIQAVGDEETVTSSRKSMVWSAIALIIAGGSAIFVDKVFAPDAATGIISDGGNAAAQLKLILESGQSQARILVLNYVKYFQTFLGAGAVLMLFLAGFKMVSAAGNEEIVTKQRQMITWIFMGLAIILVTEGLVSVFLPEGEAGKIAFNSTTAIESFSAQMGGFTNFLLTFSSAIAVLALIVGAVYMTSAVANPEQAEKGKKIILAAVLGLVVTISAFALVNTVLSGGEVTPAISISL